METAAWPVIHTRPSRFDSPQQDEEARDDCMATNASDKQVPAVPVQGHKGQNEDKSDEALSL